MTQVWTAKQFQEYQQSQQKRCKKYNNRIVVVDGIKFQSQKEADRYGLNKLRKKNGELLDFFMQVRYVLPGNVKYYLDFVEVFTNGRIDYVDVKGKRTRVYLMKKAQVEQIYKINITEA